MIRKVTSYILAVMFLPMLGLVGCGEAPEAVSSGIPLPERINLRELPSGVSAVARIEALDREVPLVVSGDHANGTFSDLPAGTYSVVIKFTSDASGVVLATSEQQVAYEGQLQQLSFSVADYQYPDDDGDKYTNLSEVLTNHDPTNRNDTPTPKRIFITSVAGEGDLSDWSDAGGESGLSAADSICQARADDAGLEGTFRAWLSDHNDDAYCRAANLQGQRGTSSCDTNGLDLGPYIRTDGFPVAEDLGRLTEKGEMFSAIQFDEYGNDLGDRFLMVWTGSDFLGRHDKSGGSCNAWTTTDADATGAYGTGNGSSFQWSESWKEACGGGTSARLFCFETSEADTVLPVYTQDDAKKVFVTSAQGTGDLSSWSNSGGKTGRAAANEICQSLAGSAGLDNADKFSAWLSTTDESAKDALQGRGPWARPDGVRVAKSETDLLDGFILTGIAQTEQGKYLGSAVWTGSRPTADCEGCDAVQTCDDWTSSLSSFVGLHGVSSFLNEGWNSADWGQTCEDEKHLYCFEGD